MADAEAFKSRKRSRDELEENGTGNTGQEEGMYFPSLWNCIDFCSESSSDDDLGPALPVAAPKKKKRKLPHEKLYISALPASPRYYKSLMHREQVSYAIITPYTDFLITTSVDGVVKFWKKSTEGVEFVKEYKAHNGEITSVSVSQDGRSFATAGVDGTVKIFDVPAYGEWNLNNDSPC
jgi:peptidylprolyl isomerase domain and WD repeat-containing protein 1